MELIQPKMYVVDFELEQCLRYVEQLDQIVQTYGPEQPIVIQVESPGGSLTGYFIFMDALKSVQNPIYTYTTGIAASAGFALLVTGARNGGQRIVGEDALLMVHGVQMGFPDGLSDIKDVEEVIRMTKIRNSQFLTPIAKSIGLQNQEELEELVRKKTKSHDLYLTATEARDLGMVDVVGAVKLIPPNMMCDLMIFDNDIENHRKHCQNPDCDCKAPTTEECVQLEEQLQEVVKESKKKPKKKSKKK